MTFLPKKANGCPTLLLAPMEGVGDSSFRKAMATIGGYDEATTEFIRVPTNAHVKSLAKVYDPAENYPIPLAAQLMGQDPELVAEMAIEIEKRGAHRIDLNCGCPSNTVTGKGAGSSLLKDPTSLYKIAHSMVKAVSVPVSLKMRSGFSDTSLFKENLLAAEDAGVKFITLHPRTKEDGYGPPANWELIALAKSLLKIPLVGNGDILTVQDALNMLKLTNCDALMIGRGSLINPFIFQEIQGYFANCSYTKTWESLLHYLTTFATSMLPHMPEKNKVNKMKQLMSFLFKENSTLLEKRQEMLTASCSTLESFLDKTVPLLEAGLRSSAGAFAKKSKGKKEGVLGAKISNQFDQEEWEW